MPCIDKLIERLGKAHYMTTIDLCKRYWQVPLEPFCRPYTAFRTPTWLYQYTIMPFGLQQCFRDLWMEYLLDVINMRQHIWMMWWYILGLIGWYHRFIPYFSSLATPLTELTKKSPSKFHWTRECEGAFVALKDLLCQEPILQSPDFSKQFLVQVDASDVGLGAVLAQGESGVSNQCCSWAENSLKEREGIQLWKKKALPLNGLWIL